MLGILEKGTRLDRYTPPVAEDLARYIRQEFREERVEWFLSDLRATVQRTPRGTGSTLRGLKGPVRA